MLKKGSHVFHFFRTLHSRDLPRSYVCTFQNIYICKTRYIYIYISSFVHLKWSAKDPSASQQIDNDLHYDLKCHPINSHLRYYKWWCMSDIRSEYHISNQLLLDYTLTLNHWTWFLLKHLLISPLHPLHPLQTTPHRQARTYGLA